MPPSDSEGEEIDDEFENGTSEAEQDEDAEAEEDIDPLDNDGDDATEGDDVGSNQLCCLAFNHHHSGLSVRRL